MRRVGSSRDSLKGPESPAEARGLPGRTERLQRYAVSQPGRALPDDLEASRNCKPPSLNKTLNVSFLKIYFY